MSIALNTRFLGFCFLILVLISAGFSVRNPAAVYCEELGYEYIKVESMNGEEGFCRINNELLEGWDFFSGKVGQEHSYCAKHGYSIETLSDGESPYSKEYAVCVIEEGFQRGLSSETEGANYSSNNKIFREFFASIRKFFKAVKKMNEDNRYQNHPDTQFGLFNHRYGNSICKKPLVF